MSVDDPFALSGQRLEGRYQIEAVVAEGGFGVVYRGMHVELHKPVAVKVLKTRESASERIQAAIYEQFVNEARTIAKLRHPNIVQALDLGRATLSSGLRAPWMALEWIEGETLKEWLRARSGTPMSPKDALALLRPVFEALACAHENSIAHRDIKPANVMVVEAAGRRPRQLLLMDFGIAKLMEDGEAAAAAADTRTTSEFATYTKRYGAPEQALARKTGPWTDVHALALILVEALTGATAYRNEQQHPDGIMGLILANERPTPARHGCDVGAWEPVLERALHRNAAMRFPSAGEFLSALEDALDGAMLAAPRMLGAAIAEPAGARSHSGTNPTSAPSVVPVGNAATPLLGTPGYPFSDGATTGAPITVARSTPASRMNRWLGIGAVVTLVASGTIFALWFRAHRTDPSTANAPMVQRTLAVASERTALSVAPPATAPHIAPPPVAAIVDAPDSAVAGITDASAATPPPALAGHGHAHGRSGASHNDTGLGFRVQ